MYTSKVKSHEIDLSLPEGERWQPVIVAESKPAKALARQALLGFPQSPRWIKTLGGLFGCTYALFGGRYRSEMRSWADALGVSTGVAYLLNCAYELSHAAEHASGVYSRILGCTAGVRWIEGLGLVHVRSMDWPLSQIGPATRLFKFVGGHHEFWSVGMPGFVGVLSGMVPGAYSVTLNWAPPLRRPTFDWGPAFLLREVLTKCATYDEAVEALSKALLSTSVFYLVCGTGRGQACVVERTSKEAAIRPMQSDVLVQANHHVAEAFQNNNQIIETHDEDSLFADSSYRANTLEKRLRRIGSTDRLKTIRKSLTTWPVQNECSVQQMVFCPKAGQVEVFRLV